MKIAVVGCGAVGSYYGGMLARSGLEVHFLLRTDYSTVKNNGVRVYSKAGDFRVTPACAREPQEIGPSDLVLIGLKTTANAEFSQLLPPLVSPTTAVMTLQNGLGNEEQLAAIFPPRQILGGLCFVCLNRVGPGEIRHLDHGQIVMGEFAGTASERTHRIAKLFVDAGVSCRVSDDLARVHWEKLVWNIPFNGLGVAGVAGLEAVIEGRLCPGRPMGRCVTTDSILADSSWTGLARELMLEVISAAQALGFSLPESLADFQLKRTATMGRYKASTLLDFERGLPLELESLFWEPLRQARRAGVATPRLEALCSVLQQLESARK